MEKIKSRIEHIENLSKMNSIVLKELKSKLKKLKSDNPDLSEFLRNIDIKSN